MTEPRDEARDVLADTLHEELYGPLQPTVMHGETVDCNCYEVADVLAARGYRLAAEPAPDVEALREAQATIEAMSGDAADLIDMMDEAAALRTALAHVLVRTHDSGCGTCDAARAVLTAEHELPSRAALHPADPSRKPEVATWDETLAVQAALHEAANDRCRDGRFDHCYDQFHSPPVQLAEWWPPADPSRREP